jgi:hypothetical protein
MATPKIEAGSSWKHGRDGYLVEVVPGNFVTKDSDDANWHGAVAFIRADEADDPGQLTYVRSAKDFADRFEPAEGAPE